MQLRERAGRRRRRSRPRDGAVDAVEAGAVGAVGEQAEGDHAPQAVDAVDRDGADRVVDLEHALDEDDRADDEQAGDGADDDRGPRADERARCGDGDEAGEHAVDRHRRDRACPTASRPGTSPAMHAGRTPASMRVGDDDREAQVARGQRATCR